MKRFIALFTSVAFLATLALPLSAMAEDKAPTVIVPEGTPVVHIDAPVTVTTPKRVKTVVEGPVTVNGTVTVTTGGQPLPVEGTVTVKGDRTAPVPVDLLRPVKLDTSTPIPVDLGTKPVDVELHLEREWWFWTAVGVVVTGIGFGIAAGAGAFDNGSDTHATFGPRR